MTDTQIRTKNWPWLTQDIVGITRATFNNRTKAAKEAQIRGLLQGIHDSCGRFEDVVFFFMVDIDNAKTPCRRFVGVKIEMKFDHGYLIMGVLTAAGWCLEGLRFFLLFFDFAPWDLGSRC